MKLFKKSVKVASLCMLVSSSVALAAGADTTLMLTQHDGENYLTWSTDVASVVRQELYRSDTDSLSDAERISVVPASDLVIEDENAGEFTDYRYWVKVIDNNGKEHVSNMASTISEENLLSTAGSSRCVAGATFKNETVDCGGATIGLKCDGDSESQPAVLTLENAKVKNVRISKSGGSDGIHCKSGNCTIENAVWEDICEDAATLTKTAKSLTIIGGTAYNSTSGPGGKPDKVFQHNAKNGTTTVIKGGFTLTGEHGKLWRSCGDCTDNGGPRNVVIDNVKVNAKIGSIVGVNRNYGDTATITNLKIKNYKSGSPKVCVEYKGVKKGSGSSTKYGEYWDTKNCNVSKSDVKKL